MILSHLPRLGNLPYRALPLICLLSPVSHAGVDPPGTSPVVITEIHHDAEPKTEPVEFVELFNREALPVDLSGWRLTGGIDYLFPEGAALPPGGFLVVAEDPATLASRLRFATDHQYERGLDNDGEEIRLVDADGLEVDRVDYGAGFPWPTAARGTGASMELLHPNLDNDLGGSWRSSDGAPTPGEPNSVLLATPADAPPAIRQVNHHPAKPVSDQDVLITAKVTDPDGVAAVTLSYQLVRPGAYVDIDDAGYDRSWTELPMDDAGTGGDEFAGDSVYSVTMPATLQKHRHLIRYRIEIADSLNHRVRVPYEDDECPNFAYFVYDGVRFWRGAEQPGQTRGQTFSAELMNNALPVYHLIASSTDVTNSQYNSGFRGARMRGTLVYDDIVYDHIEFYNRGEASTYVSGKNKWRFKFNRARDFVARDNYGKKYRTTWKTMNFNACASPWVAANRGMAGIDEAVPHRLYQLAGTLSSNTHWVQFRVIDDTDEAPANQYNGDLWGLYLAIEHPDGRLLDEHDMPDGSTFKIQQGNGDQKNQGPTQREGTADWSAFFASSAQLNTIRWWRSRFDLPSYYAFRAINRATGNVDLRHETNYYMYHHPDGRWHVVPWDLDMMYAPVKHIWPGVIRAEKCLEHAAIRTEFKNRCRELIDLLFSDLDRHGGHAAQVVEELSQIVNPSALKRTMVDLDQFMWSFHPRTASGHRGPWYTRSKVESRLAVTYTRTIPTADHEGFQQNVIDYMHDTDTDGSWRISDGDEDGYGFNYLSEEASDDEIPHTPTITYTGDAGFPVDGLRFQSSEFGDPRGPESFAGMKWRIGEIENPSTPSYQPGTPWTYEVESAWESEELNTFASEVTIPAGVLRPGHTYRARVRHKNATRRWSHWSEPIEFVAAEPTVTPYQDSLVITELMYNPLGGADHEFLELQNVGPTPIDLTNVRFTKGVDFDFPDGTIIEPGAFLLVVRNQATFEEHYGEGLPVAGEWESGDNLSNGGEQVKLSFGAGTPIHDFVYETSAPWPPSADGPGFSLTLACPAPGTDHALPGNWRASISLGGSPGASDRIPLADWIAAHGLAAGEALTDHDHDGLTALHEYGMGTSPNDSAEPYPVSAVIQPHLVAQEVADYLVVTFPRRRGADDVVLHPEFSSDLINWMAGGPIVALTSTADPATDLVTVRASIPLASEPHQFVRLRVTVK